ncbi:MAG: CerR family C-terminal domain-containing protein [Phycisphaeraceae bacterium]|nr:CerR family C-terminal domain-containing protein [Phycisphaeraceae bacterium]
MHLTQESSADTRTRLLEAAGEIFAEHGFRGATVREICERAGANIAAVNYHFRDKEGLYRAVIEFAAGYALAKYPIGGGADPKLPAEDRLRAFIRTYLYRLLDEGRPAWHGKLISREMVEPTAALDHLAETFARPQYERLRSILADLLGPAADPDRVRLCAASVVGQCLFHKHCRPMIRRLMPEQAYDTAALDALAGHIADFSLRAIASIRAGAAKGATP